MKIINNILCDDDEQILSLKGVSLHQHIKEHDGFLKPELIDTLIEQLNINTFRIPIDQTTDFSRYGRISAVIEKCIEKNLKVILDWHSFGDPNLLLPNAIDKFIYFANKHKNQLIYEICNEPTDTSWKSIKRYAEVLIPIIREIDPDSIIIVGTPNWSQNVDEAMNDPISFDNIMYSFHFYAESHEYIIPRFQMCVGRIPIICTEFGTCDASGNGRINFAKTDVWLDIFKNNHIGWINWSLCNKKESSAILKPHTDPINWNESNLSESGLYIKNKLNE